MEFTNTKTIWNKIRTCGFQSVRTYKNRSPATYNEDSGMEDKDTTYPVVNNYFFVTQLADGTDMRSEKLEGTLFSRDSNVQRIWWVDIHYWVVQTDTYSALYYNMDCVVTFPTMVTGNYTLDTKMMVEPQSATVKIVNIRQKPVKNGGKMSGIERERRFSISYYPSGESFGETRDTVTYQIPIPESEIEHTRQYQAATRRMQQLAEGVCDSLPDPTGSNIQDYLTPKSRPHFEYVNKLLKQMLAAGDLRNNKSAAVFGGYVLNLIEHAFAYRANPKSTTYTPPKDIDVWLKYDSSQGSTEFSKTRMQRLFQQNIIPYLEEAGHTTSWNTHQEHQLSYSVHNLVVDGEFQFDFSGNAYGSSSFSNLGDFTVNNLFYDVYTGNLSMRIATEYTLRDIISDHIRNRKLVPMLRCDRLCNIINTKTNYDWYHAKLQTREQKTQAKGYAYPPGLPHILEVFTEGMADHLALIHERNLDDD